MHSIVMETGTELCRQLGINWMPDAEPSMDGLIASGNKQQEPTTSIL